MLRGFCLILLMLSGASFADPADDAGTLVQQTVEALAESRGTGQSEAGVLAVLNSRFDLRAMALAALPANLRTQAIDPSGRYLAAYGTYLSRVFVAQASTRQPGDLKLLGIRQTSDAVILVATLITAPGQPRRQVDWYVRTAPPQRVVNAAVDGILITSQQRREFADVLAAGGLDGLIAALEAGDFDRLGGP